MALYDPPKKVDADVEAALLAAAWYIEEHGWCQHDEIDEDGRVCMLGALGKVIKRGLGFEAIEALGFDVVHRDSICGTPAADWNDAPGRTQAEVVERLRRAARGEFLGG